MFKYSLNPPGACTDEFVPIGGSQFFVSQMCSDTAGAPGNIVFIDAEHSMCEREERGENKE